MKFFFILQIFFGFFIVTGIIAAHMYGFSSYFCLAFLQENIHYLRHLVELHYWYAAVLYVLTYIGASCLALPGSTFFIIAAGCLFGVLPGMCFALIGLVLGATVLFLLSRYMIGFCLQQIYKDKLASCNTAIAKDGSYYMLGARMVGIFPFGMLNILAGMTLLPLTTFMWTTAVGMSPYIVLYAVAGQELANVSSATGLFSSPMIVFCSTFIVRLSVVPLLVKYMLKSNS